MYKALIEYWKETFFYVTETVYHFDNWFFFFTIGFTFANLHVSGEMFTLAREKRVDVKYRIFI